MFINRYRPMGGGGGRVILVRHNLSLIPPVEHNFEHNTLVSRVTPESIILYFSSIIRQTLLPSICCVHRQPLRTWGSETGRHSRCVCVAMVQWPTPTDVEVL